MNDQFIGVFTAMVTPLQNEQVNFSDLEKLIAHQVTNQVQGLVAVGTTGESPTLTHQEHLEVIKQTVSMAKGQLSVIAGTGANSTTEAVQLVKDADQFDVDGHLQVTPYYNKPNQEGLFQHFSAIAEATEKPIILYTIPGRCVIELENDTILRLHEKYPHIATVKESGGKVEKVADLSSRAGDSLTILSGDDALTVPFIKEGAKGIVSVASNLFPNEMVKMTEAALEGNYTQAEEFHNVLLPLFDQLLSIAPNPVAIKYALAQKGFISSSSVRLPLVGLTPEQQSKIDQLLAQF